MNQAERFLQLSLLGRETFLEAVPPAALVRQRATPRTSSALGSGPKTAISRRPALPWNFWQSAHELEIMGLRKRPGTAFLDLITIGRVITNDVQIDDPSVSRYHAFLRRRSGRWFLCDAGSKNGTRLGDRPVAHRSECEIRPGDLIHFGSVEACFYDADALFDLLRGGFDERR